IGADTLPAINPPIEDYRRWRGLRQHRTEDDAGPLYVKDSRLVARRFRPTDPGSGVFAIYPKRDYLPAKVRVFIDFLNDALAARGESASHTWAENWTPVGRRG